MMKPRRSEAAPRQIDVIMERFYKSDPFAILSELGYELIWTRPLLEFCEEHCPSPHEIDVELLRRALLEELPRRHPIAPDLAQSVAQELRAFFCFLKLELGSRTAPECLRLLDVDVHLAIQQVLSRAGKVP